MLKEPGKNKYFDDSGNFNLAAWSYDAIKELMKFTLDQGNQSINEQRKLRSYKERIKKAFYDHWFEMAGFLEEMGVIEPCGCSPRDFCKVCGGSRYRLGSMLSPDELKQVYAFTTEGDEDVARKLKEKLPEAEEILERINNHAPDEQGKLQEEGE